MMGIPDYVREGTHRMNKPTWETDAYRAPSWRLGIRIQRNPFVEDIHARVRDDAVVARYWNFCVTLMMGRRRRVFWHFIQYRPS